MGTLQKRQPPGSARFVRNPSGKTINGCEAREVLQKLRRGACSCVQGQRWLVGMSLMPPKPISSTHRRSAA
ncbi:hypothetical protein CANCADRAFT_31331 [Tortispora caseinolytica NRRL Y-17796]|uniref:Uncharacterized protein n=1 Tax=Tortispora caseinolytica NRRL Y-17796 TaxID=767744 RepID=A0A1E4TEY8_9ASCO|nr:hypothetical protein CANCADRAFT_31331 [Tortispora caseinolytica NRRL Y-17796]